jgi:hypothetical protein
MDMPFSCYLSLHDDGGAVDHGVGGLGLALDLSEVSLFALHRG